MRELGAPRTKHPTYSMAVIGPKMDEFSAVDWWRRSPFGDESIFGVVGGLGGLVMGLGTSSFTYVHRCELLANVPYMKTVNLQGLVDFGEGPLDVPTSVYVRDIEGRPEYSFLAHDTSRDLTELRDVLRELPIAQTYARIVDVRDMEHLLEAAMRVDPYGFLFGHTRASAEKAYPRESRMKKIA